MLLSTSTRLEATLEVLRFVADVHFETGITAPCMRWAFIAAVLLRAPLSWQKAAERYNRYSKGRVYLSARDAVVSQRYAKTCVELEESVLFLLRVPATSK